MRFKYIHIILLSLIVVTSCVSRTKYEEKERLLDSLIVEKTNQDKDFAELSGFISIIAEGLDSISNQENILYLPSPENGNKPLTRRQMLDNLKELQNLVERQKERIRVLEDSLTMGENTAKLKTLITYLHSQLDAKEQEINKLRREITAKNRNISKLQSKVDTLQAVNKSLQEDVNVYQVKDSLNQQILQAQNDYLNQCFYIISTKSELAAMGITNRGNITSYLDESKFVSVDIRNFKQLTIHSNRVKILSPMPQSSYALTKNGDGTTTLDIFDPSTFWQTSKYLIIQSR